MSLPDFGVPEALASSPHRLTEAATSAALSAVIELRLLVAAVDDVLTAAAPIPVQFEEHAEEAKRHKLAIGRLALSQRNARQALSYLDRLRDTSQPAAVDPRAESPE